MNQKTCFVISPIGEKDSTIRKHADAFLQLLVEPALSEFGFSIVRADQIASSSIITNDIVEYVQQAQLCLVDLTFHNPNVFYECGRRHENGKPTIQLIKEGEKLPFDVAGIRTISYNLETPWSVLESVKQIKEFVRNIEINDAYGEKSSGASLTLIAQTLNRIERKLDSKNTIYTRTTSPDVSTFDLLTIHPSSAFDKAFKSGNMEATKLVVRRLKMLPDLTNYYSALFILCQFGDVDSKNILIEVLDNYTKEEISEENLIIIFNGLKHYYSNSDLEGEALEELKSIYDRFFINEMKINNQTLAFIYYTKYYFENTIEDYKSALKSALKATELEPNDSDYWRNLADVYSELNKNNEASEAYINYFNIVKELPTEDMMSRIKKVFVDSKREKEFKGIIEKCAN